jgi:hypothetical protein
VENPRGRFGAGASAGRPGQDGGDEFDVLPGGRQYALVVDGYAVLAVEGRTDQLISLNKAAVGPLRFAPNWRSVLLVGSDRMAVYQQAVVGGPGRRVFSAYGSFALAEWYATGDSAVVLSEARVIRIATGTSRPLSTVLDNREVVSMALTGRLALLIRRLGDGRFRWRAQDPTDGTVRWEATFAAQPTGVTWSPDERLVVVTTSRLGAAVARARHGAHRTRHGSAHRARSGVRGAAEPSLGGGVVTGAVGLGQREGRGLGITGGFPHFSIRLLNIIHLIRHFTSTRNRPVEGLSNVMSFNVLWL